MHKIVITQEIREHYLTLVQDIFKNGRLKKTGNKKVLFDIDIADVDRLIKKKLGTFDPSISFEKLIIGDFEYLKNLKSYLDRNRSRIKLKSKEKSYFLTMYQRLKKTEYVKMLNVSVCAYCNRNYVFNFTKNGSLEATAQIDHFFDKKTYPWFAVSLYNLIPSCPTCNQRKSTKQDDIIHPYVESFDELAMFKLDIKNSSFYYSTKGFEIRLETQDKKAQNSIEMFNLERLYQNHKDIVLEMVQKQNMYSESYIDELLQKYEGTLFKNKEDLMRLVSSGYISNDEIGKRPLSKLIKDISQELGLI